MVMLGCIAGVLLALRRAKRERVDTNIIWDIWMWSLIGGFAGARAFYVILNWAQFKDDLWSVFKIWEGGLAFQGGLVMAILAVYIYIKARKLSFAKYVDIMVAGVILGYAFARVGCFLNGCCYGQVTGAAWGVTYPACAPIDAEGNLRPSPAWEAQVEGYPRRLPAWADNLPSCKGHVVDGKLIDTYSSDEKLISMGVRPMPRSCPVQPTQLYSSACALIICVILLVYARLPHHLGQEVSLFGMLYATYRFIVEFFRGDSALLGPGLTLFQIV
jgi:phosphatidylglycerol:prolipoprotein diacylglycerol transferase